MRNAHKYFIRIVVFLLILLWVYAAASKLIAFGHFQDQMHKQVLFPFIQALLIYLLPPVELAIAVVLTFDKTQKAGIYSSSILLFFFTGYVALVKLHFFKWVPCSCGGILEHMGWTAHLIFNLFFLALTITGIHIIKRKELK